ncbi:MAG: efflux RND transporter periplasmic adaptor subunit [Ignavibacteria bacterium]|nr:efflux RND transporter periplasmic adaptor subunit [Ignavibacteria bacterium]
MNSNKNNNFGNLFLTNSIPLIVAIFILIIGIVTITGCKQESGDKNTALSTTEEQYYCPMHPTVHSSKPGVCPICHMDLVKKTVTDAQINSDLHLQEEEVNAAQVRTVKIAESPLAREISAYSTIEVPEDQKRIVSAKFSGRIEVLYAAKTGMVIHKGEKLFTAYSPDVLKTFRELITAKNSPGDQALAQMARQKLLLFGLSQDYIASVEKQNAVENIFPYNAPFAGIIVKKNIQEGAYFAEGTVLYELSDISRLWSVAEVYEQDAASVKQGMEAVVILPGQSAKTYKGVVEYVSPLLDRQKRTVQVRIPLHNDNGQLRPGMYANTVVKISMGKGIVVPTDAIIFTGRRELVWLKTSTKSFRMQEVKIGAKVGEQYQIISGLKAGDEVVLNGNYLLDSENRLRKSIESEDNTTTELENMKAVSIPPNDPRIKQLGVYNKNCPVQGEEINGEGPFVFYRGKVIGFCCNGCDGKFKQNPEKYFQKIKK